MIFRKNNFQIFLLILFMIVVGKVKLEQAEQVEVMMDMIQKEGYPAENHFVTTEDGYILGMFRIPQKNISRRTNQKVILMMHGLYDASPTYVLSAKYKSSGFFFSDHGYDVWLGNARGNTFSRNHTKLSPSTAEFWSFSWHEIGIYDLPAMIDYILLKTQQKQLSYIGHSQGVTTAMVLLSSKPEYNKKIRILHGMTPPIIMKYNHPMLTDEMFKIVYTMYNENNNWERYPHLPIYKNMAQLCVLPPTSTICRLLVFTVMGPTPEQYNEELLPTLIKYLPAGASYRQVRHYLQLSISGKFTKYDHGVEENIRIYGQTLAPEYKLSNVKTKIHFLYGTNDWITLGSNIPLIVPKLSSRIIRISKFDGFNHIDFATAKDLARVPRRILNIENEFK